MSESERSPAAPARAVAGLDRVGSRMVEDQVAAMRRSGRRVLPLSGGPVLPLPEHVRAAIIDAIDERSIRPSRGIPELRSAIAGAIREECAAQVDPETSVLITNGAMQALSIVFRSLLDPGDRVLIPTPSFFFDGVIRMAGAEPVYVPSREAHGWRWDIDRIAGALDHLTRLIVVANPANPTSYLPTIDELAALLELAERHNCLVISDESYERLVFDGRNISSIATLLGVSSRAILIRSMTKSYALPNWRMGFIVAAPRLIDAFLKVLEWDCLHCGYAAQRAAEAAIRGPQEWLASLVPELERNRDLMHAAVQASPILSASKPTATPFLFVNVSALGGDSAGLATDLLTETGIATVPGEAFHCPGYLRLPFGGPSHVVEEAAGLLATWAAGRKRLDEPPSD